jgi:general secretion pathway protein C
VAGLGERLKQRLSRVTPVGVATALLVALIAVQGARLVWVLVEPLGPVGQWRPPSARSVVADPSFDPFFRIVLPGSGAVTGLPLKLFGVRVDEATGRGSAIIATPDGIQSSFGVGEEVIPGVRLKSVAIDHVELDRAGAVEQLFLDQSVPAPVAALPSASPFPVPPPPPAPANAAAPIVPAQAHQ